MHGAPRAVRDPAALAARPELAPLRALAARHPTAPAFIAAVLAEPLDAVHFQRHNEGDQGIGAIGASSPSTRRRSRGGSRRACAAASPRRPTRSCGGSRTPGAISRTATSARSARAPSWKTTRASASCAAGPCRRRSPAASAPWRTARPRSAWSASTPRCGAAATVLGEGPRFDTRGVPRTGGGSHC